MKIASDVAEHKVPECDTPRDTTVINPVTFIFFAPPGEKGLIIHR
jgi:hypothetical protein